MRSGSFERGDQPRSVQDTDREDYEEMLRRHRELMARREGGRPNEDGHAPAATPPGRPPRTGIDRVASVATHILNGPREARHELEAGHVADAILHGVTAAADLAWGGLTVKGLLKRQIKLRGPFKWRTAPFEEGRGARQWMGDKGFAAKGQDVHHGLIPNNGWGKYVPDAIKNQPFNLKPMDERLTHIRIHGNSRKTGLPRFSPLERYWHGVPRWWKAANGAALGHLTDAGVHHVSHAHSQPHPPQARGKR